MQGPQTPHKIQVHGIPALSRLHHNFYTEIPILFAATTTEIPILFAATTKAINLSPLTQYASNYIREKKGERRKELLMASFTFHLLQLTFPLKKLKEDQEEMQETERANKLLSLSRQMYSQTR